MSKVTGALSFFLYKFLFPATGFFTLLTLLFTLDGGSMNAKQLWTVAFLAFGTAAVNTILFIKNFNLYFKLATHFIALAGVLLATMYLIGYMARGSWAVLLVTYVLVYAIAAPFFVVAKLRKARKARMDKTYQNIYDK